MKRIATLVVAIASGCGHYECPTSLPITISLDRSTYRDVEGLYEAADYWNQGLGFEAILVERGGEVEVFEVDTVDCGDARDIPGCAYRTGFGLHGFKNCWIDISSSSRETEQEVLRHELGHCLGLEHDDSWYGIMANVWNSAREVLPEYIGHVESCR